jgi:serine/threonine protein kinase
MTMMRLRREDPRAVGSFRLHRRLGAGGMGVVYLGSDKRGQRVALKVIRPELAEDPEFRSRFAREVSAASRIRGGCTARLVAADIEAERPWLATQYVPGPSLYDKVGDEGPLPASEVAAIGAALAEGLVAVHEAGVVHRDLKPSNILLSPKGPRIIDFGIAWATGASTLTHVGTAVGSPGFLAPEQVRGVPVTPATDVFALGATLAYAATADSPFGHGSSEVMLYRVVHEEPDLRAVPQSLTLLIASCLAKDPEDRPSTVQLHERLTEIHAREARGLDSALGYPVSAPDRPTGRKAAEYARQRTERRPDQGRDNGARREPPGRETGARESGRPETHPRGSHPRGAQPREPHARDTHPREPHPRESRPREAASQGSAGRDTQAHNRTATSGGSRRPQVPGQRTPAPARPPGRDRRLLRQRLIVFVTVTLLVALGIATAQGCQKSRGHDGLRHPGSHRTHVPAAEPADAVRPTVTAVGSIRVVPPH